jgi:nitrilase
VVLPEAFVSAYPVGLDFGARVGFRLPRGREDFQRYFESSIEVPGPHTHALGQAAKEAGVHMVLRGDRARRRHLVLQRLDLWPKRRAD